MRCEKDMKKIDIFRNRRRGFTNNNQGIVFMTVIFALIVIVGGIVLLLVLSQIIVPLIILMVVIIIFSVVLKRVWGVDAPRAIGKGVMAVGTAGVPYATKGVGWFGKLIGK